MLKIKEVRIKYISFKLRKKFMTWLRNANGLVFVHEYVSKKKNKEIR